MDPLPSFPDFKFLPYTTSPNPPPLTLNNTSTWTYCGPLLPLSPSKTDTSSASCATSTSEEPYDDALLPESYHTWARATLSGSLAPRLIPFLHYLHDFLLKAGISHYWLTIRATEPTKEYDIVRWHTDDLFFDDSSRFTPQESRKGKSKGKRKDTGYWKLATTLLGPGTLFLKDGRKSRRAVTSTKKRIAHEREHICTSMRCLGCNDAIEAIRHSLAASLSTSTTASPSYGEVAFFRLGDKEGAVHSEPACDTDRIFVNVVPGTEEELKGLMRRWGMEFPRSWSFGVPVGYKEYEGLAGSELVLKSIPPSMRRAKKEDETEEEGKAAENHPSTMSLGLNEDYRSWLAKKGLNFGKVFGVNTETSLPHI